MYQECIGSRIRRAKQTRGGDRGTTCSPGGNVGEGGIIVGGWVRVVWLLRIHGGGKI